YIVTSPGMVLNHPDTVQAVLNGFAKGMAFALTQRKPAEQIWQKYSSTYQGTPDPATNLNSFNVAYSNWKGGPYPYRLGYNLVQQSLKLTQPNVVTFPYSRWVITRFAAKALKLPLGYKFHAQKY